MKSTFRVILAACGAAMLILATVVVQAEDYHYQIDDGTVAITKYTGPGGDVIIPDTINGLPVTSIGESAFSWCTGLTSVVIPDSVISIGNYAFNQCTGLTSVVIGNGVTSIGDYAFYGCTGLTMIDVDALNMNYSSMDGVLFDKAQTTLILFPLGKSGHYSIPNTVTMIGDQAFSGCIRLISIVIPDSVTSIGYWAFGECTNLTSVTIGNSVTSIGRGAFSGCTRLTSIVIPDSVTSIGGSAFQAAPYTEIFPSRHGAPDLAYVRDV